VNCINWCGNTKAECNTCGQAWITPPDLGSCTARWQPCSVDSDCCSPGHCEGGTHCEYDPNRAPPPTPAPTPPPQNNPSSPTPAPTPAPTPPTTDSGDACCTLNYKDCHANSYCNENIDQCLNQCDKDWLHDGPQEDCAALWTPCASDDDCCFIGLCINGQCERNLNGTPSPTVDTSPTTPSPTKTPTSAPHTPSPTKTPTSAPTTSSPTQPPVAPPTESPTPPEGCYSSNYKDCLVSDYVGHDKSCSMIWLPNGPPQNTCTALWGECTNDMSSCCEPAVCFGDANFASCVPPPDNGTAAPTESPSKPPTVVPTKAPTDAATTASPTPIVCTICNDEETYWMKSTGKDCTTSSLIDTKCNKSDAWTINKYCRLSCYNAGYGYDGDVCCDSSRV